MRIIFIITFLFILSGFSLGQVDTLIISKAVQLPTDTVKTARLIAALNGFLAQKETKNSDNTFVLKEDLPQTSALLDELKGIESNEQYKDRHFYKGYLTNIAQISDSNFLIQFAYMGIADGAPMLGASFTVIAKAANNTFYFSSPLQQHTVSWKTQKIGTCVFHYKNNLNTANAAKYVAAVAAFDKKLNVPEKVMHFYCCDNFPEVLNVTGIDYKLDYNGYAFNTLSAKENNEFLIIDGVSTAAMNKFDPHDLWHDRLHNVLSTTIINKPVDEGCAYLYGGSWGISWQDILKIFKQKVSTNPDADWLSLYESFNNFGESQEKHLIVGYVINALLVQKIEREKGFPAVMELLSCGKYEKGNANYFKVLDKLTGINKENFNAEVWKLIRAS